LYLKCIIEGISRHWGITVHGWELACLNDYLNILNNLASGVSLRPVILTDGF